MKIKQNKYSLQNGFTPIVVILLVVIIIIGGAGAYLFSQFKQTLPKYPESYSQPETVVDASVCHPDKGVGYPSKQLNAAADSGRKSTAKQIDLMLKEYYQKFSKAPTSLQDLVSEGILNVIPTDPVSKQEIFYLNTDAEHGCRVEIELCEGTTLYAYCK